LRLLRPKVPSSSLSLSLSRHLSAPWLSSYQSLCLSVTASRPPSFGPWSSRRYPPASPPLSPRSPFPAPAGYRSLLYLSSPSLVLSASLSLSLPFPRFLSADKDPENVPQPDSVRTLRSVPFFPDPDLCPRSPPDSLRFLTSDSLLQTLDDTSSRTDVQKRRDAMRYRNAGRAQQSHFEHSPVALNLTLRFEHNLRVWRAKNARLDDSYGHNPNQIYPPAPSLMLLTRQ
jgi:hypothetical protein